MTSTERKILVAMIAVAVGAAGALIALGKSAAEVFSGSFIVWCTMGTVYFFARAIWFSRNTDP
ncbi:MAG: hypothetical protein FJ044_03325 [Candidatus Cloacimonetes bacterium]|nr:hypothetical protein [Candidatus Cloacimonadota bacterium]